MHKIKMRQVRKGTWPKSFAPTDEDSGTIDEGPCVSTFHNSVKIGLRIADALLRPIFEPIS